MRRELITYVLDDCRATAIIAKALGHICEHSDYDDAKKLETVNVGSLEVGFQRTFGKFPHALPEFEKINSAAYWDYQRSKVYIRSDKTIRRSVKTAKKTLKPVVLDKEVTLSDQADHCPRCGGSKLWLYGWKSRVVWDLQITRGGVKRSVVRYRYHGNRCAACKAEITLHGRQSKYGQSLRAYIAYLLIELRLSHRKIHEHLATVFKVPITMTMAHDVKAAMAAKYEPTYRQILAQIAHGSLVHADETKGVVYGGGHYVWIFANLTSVAYVYSASREAALLDEVLAGFKGVLVSDFYGGYDAVPCEQQKCLIHLMRDINEDVLKHPFNDELAFIAKRFAAVLREIVETIDKYGLKKRHLGKHKGSAERFLADVAALQCVTEVGSALKKRIAKNKDKLFTFLDHDNVPWNNNNGEHAVREFTRLRNVMVTSTPKGTREYCILLSLQQTLRYRGIGFLDFLKSGRIPEDREKFAKAFASIDIHYRRSHGLPVDEGQIDLANLKGQTIFDQSSDLHRMKDALYKIVANTQAEFRRRGIEMPPEVQPNWMICPRCLGRGTDPTFSRNYLGHYQAFPCLNCGGKGEVRNPAAGAPS